MFAVNEEHPSPQSQQRPSSARSRMSAKSGPPSTRQHRPGSATPNSSHRGRGSSLKPQSSDHHHRSYGQQSLQPVPPGQARGGSSKRQHAHGHRDKEPPSAGLDMRPFLVLGREELLGQLTNCKKKQAQSDSIINQLKAENQRLESEVSKQQHRIDKILSPQYAKSSHLILEIRKEIEKSVLVRQLKAQMAGLRATIVEKDAQIESMHNNVSATTLLELSAEKEEYMVEIARLGIIIAQKDKALVQARREVRWNQQGGQGQSHELGRGVGGRGAEDEVETGDHLRHELDRLTRGYEEVLQRLEAKNAGRDGDRDGDMSVKSGNSRTKGRPKSSSSSRPGSSRKGGNKRGNNAAAQREQRTGDEGNQDMNKVSSLNELDPELTTFAQQYDKPQQQEEPVMSHSGKAQSNANSLTNINNEEVVNKPYSNYEKNDYEFSNNENNNLAGESVDEIPNGGKLQIVADAMDGNMSQVMGGLPLGCKVTANYRGEGEYYRGTVVRYDEASDTYDLEYEDGDRETRVRRECINVVGEPPKKQTKQQTRQQQEQEEDHFDFAEGARVDLIAAQGDENMVTGTVVRVLSGGRQFDVELDTGELRRQVEGRLLHKSLVLADQLHNLDEKHNVSKFAVGDKVEACYRGKTKWCPGVIAKVRAEGFDIDYDDGEKEYNVKDELIRAQEIKPAAEEPPKQEVKRRTVVRKFRIGQRVEGNYRGQGKWYPGEIAKVRTDGFDIDYDDGEKEYNVKEELMRAEISAQMKEAMLEEARTSAQSNIAQTEHAFAMGDRVEGNYRGMAKWYPGSIAKVREDGYDIEYDDGEKEYNVKEELIRPINSTQLTSAQQESEEAVAKFAVGDQVEARYRGKAKWYPGVVGKVRAEGFDIDYDDGEKEYNVKEEFIRPSGEAGRSNNNNEYDFENTNDSFRTTGESNKSQSPRPSEGKPKQQLATNDDLNDFLNGLGSDDDSSALPDYGGGGAGDYGEDFEED